MQLKSLQDIDIILASEATWRSDILRQLTIPHRCLPHRYDEPAFTGDSLVEFVRETALKKGESLLADNPDAMIISADQLICLDDQVFYKSGSREKAIMQLTRLNGRSHQLICAVAVIFKGKTRIRHESAELTMRQLTKKEIENYVDLDEPWDCAGSYKIEQLGASLFKSVSVKDPTTIIGLPANLLLDLLREFGFSNLIR
jgi:septum formation protein